MKPPLTGFFKSMTTPRGDESMVDVCAAVIADARAGLNGIDADELTSTCEMCDEHGRDVKLFQETQPGAVTSSLTPSLVAALALYTAELSGESPYGVCNGALRAADRSKCKPFVPFIWFLMHALAKCDRYVGGNVYRGVKADLRAQYPKDREVTWFQFSSCTCNIEVEQSEQFCGSTGTRTLFSIELTTGRARIITEFSLVPSEAEVLLPPNSRFKVVSHFDAGNGLTIIQLKELPPKDPIIDFDAPSSAAAPATAAAAAAPPTHAPAASGGAAALDPEVEALADSLVALKLGAKKACVAFAEVLYQEGVVHIEDLALFPAASARVLLANAGLKELQQIKVMQAVAPAPAFAPATAPSASPAAAAAFLRAFGSKGASNGQFQNPSLMAVDCDGNVVVADEANHRVQVLRLSDGACLRTIGSAGSGAGQFNCPIDVAFDGAGNIIVADQFNHRVQVLRYSDGRHVLTLGSFGRGDGQLDRPCSVAVDGRGNVLVHDGACNGRIVVFRLSDGAYMRSMCSQGSGPGQISGWGSIALDGEGNVAVVDGFNFRVQVLRYSDGAHLRTIGSHGFEAGQFRGPRGVAFDGAGNIIVADRDNHQVQVLRYSDGRHVRTLGESRGRGNGEFDEPYGVAVDGQGRIIVSDSKNHRIQVLQ